MSWGIKQDDEGKWYVYTEEYNNPPLIDASGEVCRCDCHRMHMLHCVPCCWPRKDAVDDVSEIH